MTYRSRGRSIFEVIVAVCFVGFLVGFITVLCIGNYFRAKRAQERQKQRRLAKANASSNGHSTIGISSGAAGGGGGPGPGRSSSQGGGYPGSSVAGDTTVSGYEAPDMHGNGRTGISA
eukprot:156712_1